MNLEQRIQAEREYASLPFVDVPLTNEPISYWCVRPTGTYEVDVHIGAAAARALAAYTRETKETHVLTWAGIDFCELFNRDYKGIAVGLFSEMGEILLGRGAKH